MPYDSLLVQPFRDELTHLGFQELMTAADVDAFLQEKAGTALLVINSVCGCAAGKARPAIGMALQHSVKPDKVATVFAGGDDEATAHVREILSDYPPSSPSMALFQDGKPVFMLHRRDIEPRDAMQIADILTEAFDRYCAAKA